MIFDLNVRYSRNNVQPITVKIGVIMHLGTGMVYRKRKFYENSPKKSENSKMNLCMNCVCTTSH